MGANLIDAGDLRIEIKKNFCLFMILFIYPLFKKPEFMKFNS